MTIEIRHSGETVVVVSRDEGVVEAISGPSYSVDVVSGLLVMDTDPYEGTYEVVPDADGRILPTRSKTMLDDVTVHPIPYQETSNEAGGLTVSIAS